MVAKAKEELEQEILVKEEEKQKYLAERAPPLNTSGLNLQQLQVNQPLRSFQPSSIFIVNPWKSVLWWGLQPSFWREQ